MYVRTYVVFICIHIDSSKKLQTACKMLLTLKHTVIGLFSENNLQKPLKLKQTTSITFESLQSNVRYNFV